jgi:hypothetical protein
MIVELLLPDDKMFSLIIANASSQELESVLRGMTGLDSVSSYNHRRCEVVGWKDGKEVHALRISGGWKLYGVPDAR